MKKRLLIALVVVLALTALLLMAGGQAVAGNPSDDGNCAEWVCDPDLGCGTRADLYNCHAIGNSGEEQGVYYIDDVPAADVGFPAEFGTCDIVVKWSGDFGPDPYLDYGMVFNETRCTNGYREVWGDRFGPGDPWAATPYVYTIGGEGDQVHRPD